MQPYQAVLFILPQRAMGRIRIIPSAWAGLGMSQIFHNHLLPLLLRDRHSPAARTETSDNMFYNNRIFIRSTRWVLFSITLMLFGCGGSSIMPPPPSGSGFKITKLDPGSVIAGWSTIGLIVYGTGLGYQDTVIWNDNPLKTGYDSADGTLTGIVTSNLLTAPGKITITVSDGTHTSNSLTFQI